MLMWQWAGHYIGRRTDSSWAIMGRPRTGRNKERPFRSTTLLKFAGFRRMKAAQNHLFYFFHHTGSFINGRNHALAKLYIGCSERMFTAVHHHDHQPVHVQFWTALSGGCCCPRNQRVETERYILG